jgi:hypothetical protein
MIFDGWIAEVEIDHPTDGTIVTFSDETAGEYVVEELFDLGPRPERVDDSSVG